MPEGTKGRTKHGISAKATTKTERSKPEFGKTHQTQTQPHHLHLLPLPGSIPSWHRVFRSPRVSPKPENFTGEQDTENKTWKTPHAGLTLSERPPKIPKFPLTWGWRAALRTPWCWTGRGAAASRRQLQNKKENPQLPTNPLGFLRDTPLCVPTGAHPAPRASSPGIPAPGTMLETRRSKIQLKHSWNYGTRTEGKSPNPSVGNIRPLPPNANLSPKGSLH